MSSAAGSAETVTAPVVAGETAATPLGATVHAFFARAESLMTRAKARSAAIASEISAKTTAEIAAAEADPNVEPAVERASEMLDRTGEAMGRWATAAALQVRRATALAREEAEDMLAEAQEVRNKKR